MKLHIMIDEQAYEVDVENTDEEYAPQTIGNPPPPVDAAIQSIVVATTTEARSAAGSDVEETKVCRSPVTGIVVRVNNRPGEQLRKDDLIVVLEAMKMETSIRAPIAGKLKSVKIAPGDAVKVNQVLLEFE